jgi:hypothetical protein
MKEEGEKRVGEVRAETEMRLKLEWQVRADGIRSEADKRIKEEMLNLQTIHAKEIQALIDKNQQEI